MPLVYNNYNPETSYTFLSMMNKLKYFIIVVAMLFPKIGMAQDELSDVVEHYCRKLLAEKGATSKIEHILHLKYSYNNASEQLKAVKPEVMTLLVKTYMNEQLLNDYSSYLCVYANNAQLDYAKFDSLINVTENLILSNEISKKVYDDEDRYLSVFFKTALNRAKEGKECKPLKLEASDNWMSSYQSIVDSLTIVRMSLVDREYKSVKSNLITFDKVTENRATEIASTYTSYLRDNIHTFYANFLYRFFRNERTMKMYVNGSRLEGYREFCGMSDFESMRSLISKDFYRWCDSDNNIKKAKKLVSKGKGIGVYDLYTGLIDYINSIKDLYSGEDLKDCDVNPSFPGGDTALMSWLSENLKYPAIAQENGIQGRFLVSFIVEKDGSISNIEPEDGDVTERLKKYFVEMMTGEPYCSANEKNKHEGYIALKKEALRIIRIMPNWVPGKLNGKPVQVRYKLPITFRLQ